MLKKPLKHVVPVPKAHELILYYAILHVIVIDTTCMSL